MKSIESTRALSLWTKIGPSGFLTQRQKALFLISRQSRSVSPASWWFNTFKTLLSQLLQKDYVIITTEGILYHDIIYWSAAKMGASRILVKVNPPHPKEVVSERDSQEDLLYEEDDTVLKLIPPEKLGKKAAYCRRDTMMLHLADLVIALAVREKGAMYQIAQNALKQKREIYVIEPPASTKKFAGNICLKNDDVPLWDYKRTPIPKLSITLQRDYEGIELEKNEQLQSFLWHYTRKLPGPWPGQAWADYAQSLLDGCPHSAHSAFDSLVRIVQKEQILASHELIRGNFNVVCFTANSPREVSRMRKYNHALHRWNFELYGLGISREYAQLFKLEPVHYGNKETYSKLPPSKRFLFQASTSRSGKFKWEEEKEYRSPLHIDLSKVPAHHVIPVVRTKAEADYISSISRFTARYLKSNY